MKKSTTDPRKRKLQKLAKSEIGLRNAVEKVAAERRRLPAGAPVTQDYELIEAASAGSSKTKTTKLSQLFGNGHKELLVYHYMWAPKDAKPCPMCTMWCDGYDRIEPYVRQRASFVLVAKAPIKKLQAWARKRGWKNIRLLSSYGTTFNADFKAEEKDGSQMPMISVFTKDRSGKVRHFYQKSAALSRSQQRGIDQLTPVWNLFDLLPSGRGDWYPNYEL